MEPDKVTVENPLDASHESETQSGKLKLESDAQAALDRSSLSGDDKLALTAWLGKALDASRAGAGKRGFSVPETINGVGADDDETTLSSEIPTNVRALLAPT
eukprot:SAG22_NODE_207_length_15278_cov_4.056855_9_plen_102_part_00